MSIGDNVAIIAGYVERITKELATGKDHTQVGRMLMDEGLTEQHAQFIISVAHTAANVILDVKDGITQPEALLEFNKLGLEEASVDHILMAARQAIQEVETKADSPENNYNYWLESYNSLLSRTQIPDDSVLTPYFILFRGVMAMRSKGMTDEQMVEKMAAHVPMGESERYGFVSNCTLIDEALAQIRAGDATSIINAIATRRYNQAVSILICGLARDYFAEKTGKRPVLF